MCKTSRLIVFKTWFYLFQILESGDGGDEKAITAMGILNTIETILSVMGEKPEVRGQLEQAVLRAIVLVLTGSHMEFYEEAFSLICDLTTTAISPAMWEAFQVNQLPIFFRNCGNILRPYILSSGV